jgi:hypothetical protein
LPVGSLPTSVTCPLRSTGITPASLLLRSSPPLAGASVLSASRLEPLVPFPLPSPARFSRSAREPSRGSRRLHAGCRSGGLMPSPELFPEDGSTPGSDIAPETPFENPSRINGRRFIDPGAPRPWQLIRFRHFCSGSLALASLDLAVLDLRSKFDCNAHHHGFLTAAACSGLRSAHDCRPRRAFISRTVVHRHTQTALVTHDPQRT